MLAAAAGETLDPKQGAELAALGYAQQNPDGSFRLTPEAKALARAATRGDVRGALDADGKAQERAAKQQPAGDGAGEQPADPMAALTGGQFLDENGKPIKAEPKKGGGGGGSKKPAADDADQKKIATANATAEKLNIPSAVVDLLRQGAEEGSAQNPALLAAGLIDANGDATDSGRRALSALERGDVRQFRAALQDAKARQERTTAQQERIRQRQADLAAREAARGEQARTRQQVTLQRLARRARSGSKLSDAQGQQLVDAGMATWTPMGALKINPAEASAPRMRRTGLGTLQNLARKSWTFKHGKHDQSTHGRRGGGARAAGAAYAQARKDGKTPQEARQIRRDVMQANRNQQRIANINQQLRGNVSASQRSSLEAERTRLTKDTIARASRTPQAAEAIGQTHAPTVRGRGVDDGQGVKPSANGLASNRETRATGQDPNRPYTLEHKIVDMADVTASNTATGAINEKYDPALQPRDRSRAASQAQIDTVARNLNADALVADIHRIDSGSPIVDAHGNVLSGNGRTLALQRAAELYPAQYAAYKQAVKDQAAALGIDPATVDGMKNPVLVRELKGGADPVAFAREANTSGTLRMSPLEQARVDANVLTHENVLKLHVGEGGIDQALRSRDNKPFVNDFLKTVPENERANLLTRDGDLNQMGLYRMKAALYTKAFPGEHGGRMAESMLESLDPDVKTIQNGISASLPAFSRATSLTRSGARERDLDLSDDFAKAIDVYARIKDNPALTANTRADQIVRKYLDQSSMFDRELTPQQERLLVHIDSISRKPTAVRDMFNKYADIVESSPMPGQSSLFGDMGRMTKDQLIDAIVGSSAPTQSQGFMFGQPSTQPSMGMFQ